MSNSNNIIIIGFNFYGEMAPSQRIQNLFIPLIANKNNTISNISVNSNPCINNIYNINYLSLKYQLKKPLTIISFLIKSLRFIKKSKLLNSNNILYCYGYPWLENIFLIIYAKRIGYKISFDIVENQFYFKRTSKTFRNKVKHDTILFFARLIPYLADVCFVISNNLLDFFSAKFKRNFKIVHLPISVNIRLVSGYRKMKNENDSIKIFYGGSFGNKDGIPYLVKGFEEAYKQNKNLELFLTGKPDNEAELQLLSLLNNSDVKNKINYLGYLTTDEYYTAMANSDILCMLRTNSKYANAGFPFKLGEYLASGNAVIATNVGDVPLYLKSNINALLIEPENSLMLSKSLVLLANNKTLRNKIGNNGKKVAEQHFDNIQISNLFIHTLIGN